MMERYVREGCLNHLSDLGGFDAVFNELLEPGLVRNVVTVPAEANNLHRTAHGGYLMQLVDVAGCMAGYSLGKTNVTQQSSQHFVRPVRIGDTIRIEAKVVHNGRSSILVDVCIRDSQNQACLFASVTLYVTGLVGPEDPIPTPYLGRNKW